MGARARALTESHDGARTMRFEVGRCAALHIDPDRQKLECAIYEVRPDCCRWLQPGSSFCRQQIADKAERAAAALESP